MSLWLVVLLYEWGNNLVVVVDDDVVWVIPFCYLPMSLLGNKPKFGKLMAINIFMGLVMILLASLSLESLMVLCLHNWQLLEFTQLPSMSCQCAQITPPVTFKPSYSPTSPVAYVDILRCFVLWESCSSAASFANIVKFFCQSISLDLICYLSLWFLFIWQQRPFLQTFSFRFFTYCHFSHDSQTQSQGIDTSHPSFLY